MTTSRNAREGRFLVDRFPPRHFSPRYVPYALRPARVELWDHSDPAAPRLVSSHPLQAEATRGGMITVAFSGVGPSPNWPSYPRVVGYDCTAFPLPFKAEPRL